MVLDKAPVQFLDSKGDKEASIEAYKIRYIAGKQITALLIAEGHQ